MKILLDATCVENRYCGYRVYAEQLLRELLPLLRAEGHAVTLLLQRRLDAASPLRRLAAEQGLTVVEADIPVLGIRRFLASLYRCVPPPGTFDLYFCLHSNPLSAPSARRRIAVLHDLTALRLPGYFQRFGFLKRLWLRFEYAFLLRRMDSVIAVSASTRGDAVELLGIPAEQITVVPEAGQALPAAAAGGGGLPPGVPPPYFLTFGARPHKNIGRTIEAFCRFLEESGLDYRLAVVGSCEAEKARLRGTCPAWALERVVEVRPVDPPGLAALYRGCFSLLYVPLYEGFGLPLVEAMAAGRPAITSNCSSLPEVAGDAALLVDPCDLRAIQDALKYMTSGGTQPELARKAAARADLFSWKKSAEEVLRVMEDSLR
jgi:glycosyltransferase involved in cell wall biosynthesis